MQYMKLLHCDLTDVILTYVKEHGYDLKSWYAGITNDPSRRLKEHEHDKGIYGKFFHSWDCKTENKARQIEQALRDAGISIYEDELQIIAGQKKPSKYIYVFLAIQKKEEKVK